jgi:tetrahydromethanopterin S-methyltransferase subunit B
MTSLYFESDEKTTFITEFVGKSYMKKAYFKNSKVILFTVAIFAIAGLFFPNFSYADVSPPKKQTNLGIIPEKVICSENLFKVFLKANGKPLCVKPITAIKMIELGLTKSTSADLAKKFMEELKNKTSVGQVKKIGAIPIDAKSKFYRSNAPATGYKVLFEVCAKDTDIRSPEIILSSQTATSYVKLATKIPANTCEINTGIVSALKSETIQVTLVNEGGITQKITQLENRVNDLKQKLESEKAKLSIRVQEGNIEKQNERIDSIVKMRNELNQAKEELNRYLFALNITPKIKSQDLEIPKTFTGVAIEGITVTLLAANQQLLGEGYDVAFEMCAANQTVRIPTVIVSSDIESKPVKLADRIIPNTCQVSGVKIKASSAENIQVSIGDTASRSALVPALEKTITDLVNSLESEKLALRELTHFSPRPSDFNDQAAKIAENILELRAQITLEKAKLYNLLNQVYK